MENGFEVAGRKFKIHKIDVFKQFHIVRRIAPILGEMIPLAHKLSKVSAPGDEQYEALAPIMNGIAKLSDEDANFVLIGLCQAVEMYQPASNSWARVATSAGLMFQDLDLPVVLQIAGRAFQFNLSNFFASLPQASAGT